MSKLRWGFITLCAAGLIVFSFYRALVSSSYDEAAGWVQNLLAAIGVPILWYELDQIRKTIGQKPIIDIGVASVHNLPLSRIRNSKKLSTDVLASRGFAHFMLIVRNKGTVGAKFVKIHLEYLRPAETSLLTPTVKVSEFSEDKNSFKAENNADFIFNGGYDWGIHPNDFEIFSFHMSTVVVKQIEPHEIREYPEPGDYNFICTVWAEGLNHPKTECLIVRIRENR